MTKKAKNMTSKLKVTIGETRIEIEGSNEMIHLLFNESIDRLNRKTCTKPQAASEDAPETDCEEDDFDGREVSDEWSSIEGIIIQNRAKSEEEY